jgi:hypothetical protein
MMPVHKLNENMDKVPSFARDHSKSLSFPEKVSDDGSSSMTMEQSYLRQMLVPYPFRRSRHRLCNVHTTQMTPKTTTL